MILTLTLPLYLTRADYTIQALEQMLHEHTWGIFSQSWGKIDLNQTCFITFMYYSATIKVENTLHTTIRKSSKLGIKQIENHLPAGLRPDPLGELTVLKRLPS